MKIDFIPLNFHPDCRYFLDVRPKLRWVTNIDSTLKSSNPSKKRALTYDDDDDDDDDNDNDKKDQFESTPLSKRTSFSISATPETTQPSVIDDEELDFL